MNRREGKKTGHSLHLFQKEEVKREGEEKRRRKKKDLSFYRPE